MLQQLFHPCKQTENDFNLLSFLSSTVSVDTQREACRDQKYQSSHTIFIFPQTPFAASRI